MIADLKQPAQHWLADIIQNFGKQLESGDEIGKSDFVWNGVTK